MATCPECDAEIELEDTDLEEIEVGDPWSCDACGSHLRVAGVDPVEFDSDEDADDEDADGEDEDGAEEDDLDDDLDDDDDDEDDEDGGWDE
jgi:lysine biosynthesis protein LysW